MSSVISNFIFLAMILMGFHSHSLSNSKDTSSKSVASYLKEAINIPKEKRVGEYRDPIFYPARGVLTQSIVRIPLYKDGLLASLCSGVLVAEDLVLTARHCTSSYELRNAIIGTGGVHQDIEISHEIESLSPENELSQFVDERGLVSEVGKRRADLDLLVLRLSEKSKFAPIPLLNINDLEQAVENGFRVVGFPGGHGREYYEQTPWGDFVQVPLSAKGLCYAEFFKVDHPTLLTDCLTRGGMSGAPVLTAVNGKVFVVGIHSAGSGLQLENLNGPNLSSALGINLLYLPVSQYLSNILSE